MLWGGCRCLGGSRVGRARYLCSGCPDLVCAVWAAVQVLLAVSEGVYQLVFPEFALIFSGGISLTIPAFEPNSPPTFLQLTN